MSAERRMQSAELRNISAKAEMAIIFNRFVQT